MAKKIDKNLINNIWNYLIDLAEKGEKRTYGDISNDLHIGNPKLLGSLLDPIQDHCLKKEIPALTSLIINKDFGMPGDGFHKNENTLDNIWKEVYNYNWENENFNNNLQASSGDRIGINEENIKEYNSLLEGFFEGEKKEVLHKKYERNSELIRIAKEEYKKRNKGKLVCEICNFSFKDKYGKDYIEAHHKIPLSKINGKTETKIEDLAMLCANCHRMIHFYNKNGGCKTIDELKKIYELNN